MLSVNNVTVSYGRTRVLKDFSASASDGEIAGLLGPNGSGKTTLLRFISGLLKADAGSIVYHGAEIDTTSRFWRSVLSYVPDDGGTIPILTVEEQLLLRCRLSGVSQNESVERVKYIIHLLQIGGFKNSRSSELSTGLKKKLGIGLGIIGNAKTYLFDEPFASLDLQAVEIAYGILIALKKSGAITVVATNSIPLQAEIWDRFWNLSDTNGTKTDKISIPETLDAGQVILPWLSTSA